MSAPMMTPHDWSRIGARAQESHYLRRWSRVMREMGDVSAAVRLGRRAEKAEAEVLRLAAACGAEVVQPAAMEAA